MGAGNRPHANFQRVLQEVVMGVLANFRDSVVLVNRTSQPLNVRYDGEDITLQPGENPGFPAVAVPYAKRQNPLMGSKHPINPTKFIALVGVKDSKDDISPIPDEVLRRAARKLEVVDRDGEHWGSPMRGNVKLLNRGFDPYEAQVDVTPDIEGDKFGAQ
jgi:hypothetical protein